VNNNGYIDRNEWDGSLDTFYQLDRNGDNRIASAEMNAGAGRRSRRSTRTATTASPSANGSGHIEASTRWTTTVTV
jgi:hypothetical protein